MTFALIVLALLFLLRDDSARPSNRLGPRNRHR
jgi:hypothetical protein